MAASARRSLAREAPDGEVPAEVDEAMMERLGAALERIEADCDNFAGAMVFRGTDAAPLVSLLPDFGADEARRTLMRVATAVRMQFDLLIDSTLGPFVDSVISTERGAVLVRAVGDDLLVVNVAGSPAAVAPAWKAIAVELEELRLASRGLFRPV